MDIQHDQWRHYRQWYNASCQPMHGLLIKDLLRFSNVQLKYIRMSASARAPSRPRNIEQQFKTSSEFHSRSSKISFNRFERKYQVRKSSSGILHIKMFYKTSRRNIFKNFSFKYSRTCLKDIWFNTMKFAYLRTLEANIWTRDLELDNVSIFLLFHNEKSYGILCSSMI